MNKSLYSYNKMIFQTCGSKELRILVLSADYQFDVILVLNNLGSGYMIRLSRDELDNITKFFFQARNEGLLRKS